MTQIPSAPNMPGSPTTPAGMKPHRGTMILVMGILGICCCFIVGVVAWIFGNADLKEMDAGTMDPAGRDMTKIGKICGMIGCGLAALGIVFWILSMILGLAGAAAGAASHP